MNWTRSMTSRQPTMSGITLPACPAEASTRGLEAVKAHLRDFLGTWETYKLEEVRVIDAGERVVQLCRLHAKGKGGGVPLDVPIAYVHTFRGGKFARTMAFRQHDEALEAVGLREWARPRQDRIALLAEVSG